MFSPPRDVAFTISTPRQQYTVRHPFIVNYRIANVSARAVYVSTTQSFMCPSLVPHMMATLEDSAGRHIARGYGSSCAGTFPTVTLGAHRQGGRRPPPSRRAGAYRIEATLYGWSTGGHALTDGEMRQLPGLGAALLRGEVPASKGVTLTK